MIGVLRVIVMMYFHEQEDMQTVVIYRGMGAIITVSSLAIIAIGIFPPLMMQLARNSVPF